MRTGKACFPVLPSDDLPERHGIPCQKGLQATSLPIKLEMQMPCPGPCCHQIHAIKPDSAMRVQHGAIQSGSQIKLLPPHTGQNRHGRRMDIQCQVILQMDKVETTFQQGRQGLSCWVAARTSSFTASAL